MERRFWDHEFTISYAHLIVVVLVIVILTTALLSDIDSLMKLGIVVVLFGVIYGTLKFGGSRREAETAVSNQLGVARIDSSNIPVRGGIAAGIAIAILLTGALIELPSLRLLVVPGIVGGLVFGGILLVRRRHHA